MGLQEEEEVIKERSPIAERIWSNGGTIQEDRCRTCTGMDNWYTLTQQATDRQIERDSSHS